MKAIIFFCCLLPIVASAQDSSNTNKAIFLHGLISYDFLKGYGVSIGTSASFRSINKGKAHLKKDDFVSLELGGYRYPFEYTSMFVNAGIGIRYARSEKHFSELSFSQGLLRTFYDGKVYEMDQNGNIKELTLFGRTYLTSQFAYSLNYRINNGSLHAWFIQLKPSVWIQYPYNSFLKLHLSMQAGINYSLKKHEAKSYQP
jgi:hypothetical protein